MSKTKWYIIAGTFLCLVAGITIASIKSVEAETTSTTFPVDEAGIAAYVKLDNIENIDIDALAETLHSVERQAESYVVGTVKVLNDSYPHVYIGMDGWIVAYYLKEEEVSRIIQWANLPGPINTTTLKDAIDIICQKTGVSYSTPVKYYDFEFPEANKMTLIAESISLPYVYLARSSGSNSFYVTVPGMLYEASYGILATAITQISLDVDGTTIVEKTFAPCGSLLFYGYYDTSTYFEAGATHYVSLHGRSCYSSSAGSVYSATALIYKN